MFYTENPSPNLRCGDVVCGFRSATPKIDDWHTPDAHLNWSIQIESPQHFVVLTPCCSIEKKTLALAPLEQIRPGFHTNPFFAENLLRLNKQVPPERALPPEGWERLPAIEREKRLALGPTMIYVELFVYDKHELLPEYRLDKKPEPINESFYMVDFKRIFRVDCERITREGAIPERVKLLELSIEARSQLRVKLSKYFGRVPAEDML